VSVGLLRNPQRVFGSAETRSIVGLLRNP
jgi:hypothetical protein